MLGRGHTAAVKQPDTQHPHSIQRNRPYEGAASASSPSTCAVPSRGALTLASPLLELRPTTPLFDSNKLTGIRLGPRLGPCLSQNSRNQRLLSCLRPLDSTSDPHKVAPILGTWPPADHTRQAQRPPRTPPRVLRKDSRQHSQASMLAGTRATASASGRLFCTGAGPHCAPGRAPVAAEPAAERGPSSRVQLQKRGPSRWAARVGNAARAVPRHLANPAPVSGP